MMKVMQGADDGSRLTRGAMSSGAEYLSTFMCVHLGMVD